MKGEASLSRQGEEAYIEDVMSYLAYKVQRGLATKQEEELYEQYMWHGFKAIFKNKRLWKKLKKEYEKE